MLGHDLFAPEFIDLEVLSTWRGHARSGQLDEFSARQALSRLRDLRVKRFPHQPLIARIWELRENLTAYDASYVALAEELNTTLLTRDRGIALAPGTRCEIELLES